MNQREKNYLSTFCQNSIDFIDHLISKQPFTAEDKAALKAIQEYLEIKNGI